MANCRAFIAWRRSPPHSAAIAAVPAEAGATLSDRATLSRARCAKVLGTPSKFTVLIIELSTGAKSFVTTRWSSPASLKQKTARWIAPLCASEWKLSRNSAGLEESPRNSSNVKGKSRTRDTRRRAMKLPDTVADCRPRYRSVCARKRRKATEIGSPGTSPSKGAPALLRRAWPRDAGLHSTTSRPRSLQRLRSTVALPQPGGPLSTSIRRVPVTKNSRTSAIFGFETTSSASLAGW
mmetsp:Transcript_126333/g.218904  ORF Transcript_126333/g.218904 Transcript_126333/m.218904 type:complete len:237 (-) Transcript_126333:26-736(-)